MAAWHSHNPSSTPASLSVVSEPLKTQYIDESNMFFSDSPPKELTQYWSLRVKTHMIPLEQDTEFEFGLTVVGRAKLFVDGELIVDNWTKQTRGEAFFGTGTVEEKGRTLLKKGVKHEIFVDFCNIRGNAGDDSDGTVTLGGSALRIGGAPVLDEERGIRECVEIAKDETVDAAVVVVGLNGDWESEGYDRTTLKLPGRTDELVRAVAMVNERVIIVTQSVRVYYAFSRIQP